MESNRVYRGRPEGLTKREWEVLQQVLLGNTNKEAARALFCSRRTVEFHLNQIYRKLNVHNRLQAMRSVVSLVALPDQGGSRQNTRHT